MTKKDAAFGNSENGASEQLPSASKEFAMSSEVKSTFGIDQLSNSGDNLQSLKEKAEDKVTNSKLVLSTSSDSFNDIVIDDASRLSTKDAQHHELESRIVKECLKEFTKSTMYFSYNFGKSLDRSIPRCSLIKHVAGRYHKLFAT